METKELQKLRRETITKLEAIKENLQYNDDEQNYCDMVNTMIDYDNEAQDSLYLYDTCKEIIDFVDEEILQYLIESNAEYGLDRLRYFINDTYNSNIYKLDGYGNLENVNDNDFEYCIDETIEKLQDAIEEVK